MSNTLFESTYRTRQNTAVIEIKKKTDAIIFIPNHVSTPTFILCWGQWANINIIMTDQKMGPIARFNGIDHLFAYYIPPYLLVSPGCKQRCLKLKGLFGSTKPENIMANKWIYVSHTLYMYILLAVTVRGRDFFRGRKQIIIKGQHDRI